MVVRKRLETQMGARDRALFEPRDRDPPPAGGKLLDEQRLLTAGELAGLAALPDDWVTSLAALAHQEVQAAQGLGCTLPNPFIALSFVALPVIPRLKLTDFGLVDVEQFAIIPLQAE